MFHGVQADVEMGCAEAGMGLGFFQSAFSLKR
jgi:hypothetical protein